MEKSEIIKNFNDIVKDLLEQVAPLIGTKYFDYFKKLIRVNSLLPIQNFVKYGTPHKKKIIDKDPNYFLNEDTYTYDIQDYFGDKADKYLTDILNLKLIYSAVDEDSKENLWDIVMSLNLLAEEYSNKSNIKIA